MIPCHPARDTSSAADRRIQAALPKILAQMETWKVELKAQFVRDARAAQAAAGKTVPLLCFGTAFVPKTLPLIC